jgi:hypothetical protein
MLEAGANPTRPGMVTGDYRPCASTGVVGGCVYRREFDCCRYGGGGRRKWGKVNGKDRKAYTQPMMQVKPVYPTEVPSASSRELTLRH